MQESVDGGEVVSSASRAAAPSGGWGGRVRDAILINTELPGISREFLMQKMKATAIQRVAVTMAAGRLRCAS